MTAEPGNALKIKRYVSNSIQIQRADERALTIGQLQQALEELVAAGYDLDTETDVHHLSLWAQLPPLAPSLVRQLAQQPADAR